MTSSPPPIGRTGEGDLRKVASQVLGSLALTALLSAVTVFLLMVVVYVRDDERVRDWPGHYWFAVVPLLVASLTLMFCSWRIDPRPREVHVDEV